MSETLQTAIIDDDEALGEALCELLRSLELPCRYFPDAGSFLSAPDCSSFGCIVTDLRMPGLGGLALQAELAARGLRIPLIIMTSNITARSRARALAAGARAVLIKPLSQATLLPLVRAALADTAVSATDPKAEDR